MFPQKAQRTKWSLKTSFWSAICVAVCISIVVIFGLKQTLWLELEIITGILSLLIFLYLFFVLYHGIRFDKGERYTITWHHVDFPSVIDGADFLDSFGVFTSMGADNGIVGIIFGFILDLVVSILLSIVIAFLIWAGINVLLTTILILFLPVFYLFRRTLRYIVAKGRFCYKNTGKAFRYAAQATIICSLWLYGILVFSHYLAMLHG